MRPARGGFDCPACFLAELEAFRGEVKADANTTASMVMSHTLSPEALARAAKR